MSGSETDRRTPEALKSNLLGTEEVTRMMMEMLMMTTMMMMIQRMMIVTIMLVAYACVELRA